MTIHAARSDQRHTTAIRPTVASFADLQSWIDARLEAIEQDLNEGEVVQSVGSHVLKTKRAELLDVAWVIRDAVAAEALDPVHDALEIRRLAGDR